MDARFPHSLKWQAWREGCPLKREVYLRVIEAARYIVRAGATVRACAVPYSITPGFESNSAIICGAMI